jgi:chemotaxis protein methyltransferase CheR
MGRLINALTVGETYFFRNEAQINALATHVLPTLIVHKRAAAAVVGPNIQPQLRIWSAGCASGEEPYSLAILLKELLPDIHNWHILILATDINQDSLVRARQACYSDWSFRETRARALRAAYFDFDAAARRYQLRQEIRHMVTFSSLNLIEDDYPAIYNNTVSMDLILCRNVTIYFTETDTRRVVKKFYEALVDGGWLVVGHSEPSLATYRAFQTRSFPDTLLYQKTGQPHPWPDDWAWLDPANGSAPDTRLSAPKIISPPAATPGPAKTNGAANLHPARPALPLVTPKDEAAPSSLPQLAVESLTPVEVDPYETACILLKGGRSEEAIETLKRKLAAAPEFAPAYSLLGRVYANLGRWVEARHWCESALKLDKLSAETYYVLALIYDYEHELELAIEALKRAIYLSRDEPLFHFNLATLYKKAGHTDLAQRSYRNASRILEKWPPAAIVPDTGGATARHLLEAIHWMLREFETGE